MTAKNYAISIYTEDVVGILNRITIVFTRRHININSFTTSECEIPHVFRFTICINATEEVAKKVVAQIQKQIEILRVVYHEETDVVHRCLALYKIQHPAVEHENSFSNIINKYSAKIIHVSPNYVVVEKAGILNDIDDLFNELKPFGILEHNRSGQVVVVKPMENLTDYLQHL